MYNTYYVHIHYVQADCMEFMVMIVTIIVLIEEQPLHYRKTADILHTYSFKHRSPADLLMAYCWP